MTSDPTKPRRPLDNPFLRFAAPGQFYSPLPDPDEIAKNADVLFRQDIRECPGIALNESGQLELLKALAVYHRDLPFRDEPTPGLRYYYRNDYFSHGDAVMLHALMRHFKPSLIVEVGSGFSSAVMLDTNDRFLKGAVRCGFIDPYPNRLMKLMNEQDRKVHFVIHSPLQEVPLDIFLSLNDGDFLFVDSSHVLKIGSDVARLFFEILPRLKPGVIIHVHDIFWPFEYPRQWLLEGRAWNEAYILRAFLSHNAAFQILYFNHFMSLFHADALRVCLPLCLRNPGGGLWFRKTSP
ncbi:MAG: class I SAM-dependent methyltransferase [Lentisphaerae bacterium]|nr:class I SAM-dependent methyltransferase [Lentisphaerota bacterium]